MTTTEMHRQGDVLIRKIEALPEGLTERKSNVLVEGEVTGHAHRLAAHGRILETAQGLMFLHILQATQIVHEEHHAITLEPGYYEVVRQREYIAPELSRMVVD